MERGLVGERRRVDVGANGVATTGFRASHWISWPSDQLASTLATGHGG